MSAAAAMAFVAMKPSGPLWAKSDSKNAIDKLRQNRAALFRNKLAMPGPEREGGPMAAADEEYAKRAYPAAYVPFELTRNARAAWSDVRARALGRATQPLAQWTLVGPSSANDPDVLTFSGAPYTTSGRVTGLALAPNCTQDHCTLYLAAAGGGIWKTDRALDTSPSQRWNFISESFATNAIGTLVIDPTDPTGNTLYAGTGESHASADSEAGFGIYKTTDGGATWTHLAAHTDVPAGTGVDCDAIFGRGGFRTAPAYSGPAFDGRAISSIVIDRDNPSILYVGSTRAVRGVSSVLSGGVVSLAPGLPPYGLWRSTDGGATFTLLNYQDVCLNPDLAGDAGIIQASFGSTRGVNRVEFDPSTSSTLYAAAFPQNNALPVNTKGGVWRSRNGGANWMQIKSALNPAFNTDRAEFAVTRLANGNTRMYVGVGNSSDVDPNRARFYRSNDVATGSPTFTDLTTDENIGYCGQGGPPFTAAQCWYDNVVYSPPGRPDIVYLGGAYSYATYGFSTNGRAFLRSSNAGASFTDMTWDATTNPTPPGTCCQPNSIAPNGMHPDSHAIAQVPGTNVVFFGSDGGIVRSGGSFSNISSQCTTERGLTGSDLTLCQQLLSAVPTRLFTTYNDGLSTLQFQSVSVSPTDPNRLMGGTQDNGTFEKPSGSIINWPQKIYGDGGQSGFNVGNPSIRFNSFTGNFHDVNFRNGNPLKWVIASGPIVASGESAQFYSPIIADPVSAGTIFQGSLSVWRTQDWAGNPAFLEANCPEFTTSGADPSCGDFVQIGPAGATNLTADGDYRGTGRTGGNVAALARASSDTATLWAATTTGRVFISKNADAAAGSVTYTRLDSLAANSPGRFISGITVDPANPNHAWLVYSSYSALTPSTPGHVFSVTYDPVGGTAAWTKLDSSGGPAFPDFPATGVAFDSVSGDLYVSNDWGVLRLPNGSTDWEVAGTGLPMVEVAGLTIVPNARKLYAATHGRSAWQLTLP
jgi:hypothetical protein